MPSTDNDTHGAIDGAAIASGEQPDGDSGVAGGIGSDAQTNGGGDARTTAEPPKEKRKGGWPKGKPRRPADGTASATGTATGTANRAGNARNAERMDREKTGVLAQQIMAFHQIAAMATSVPELMIDEREAGLLAASVRELSAHYGPVVSGPAMLWVQFAGVAAMIYVPRVPLVAMRLAAMRKPKPAVHTPQGDAQSPNVIHGDFTRKDDDPFAPGKIG